MATVVVLVIGVAVGVSSPDIDLAIRWPKIIEHRSIFTHSMLLPFIISLFTVSDHTSIIRRGLLLGCLAGVTTHLAFDLNSSFFGAGNFQHIYVPWIGWSLRWVVSIPWLALNIWYGFRLGLRAVGSRLWAALTGLAVIIVTPYVYSLTTGEALLLPAIFLVGGFVIAIIIPD